MQLNEPQRQAVLHEQGPLLVFAGAGSGKTRVITYRIANLIANLAVPPHRILAVTFTNKAAAEMQQRIAELIGPELTSDLWVGTFHSICCRLLRRYHGELGLQRSFVIYDDSDQKALLSRIIKRLGLDDRLYPPKKVLARIHREKQEGRRPQEVDQRPGFDATLVELYDEYEKALLTASAVDFDDLILHVMRLAEGDSAAGEELRQRFSHLLVDEFQDTNHIQYRLVRALALRTRNLCVVGDDDQSIYSWRGADVRNIRGFRTDFPGARVVKLEQNYRSTGNIVAAALGVISGATHRESKQLWTASEAGCKVLVRATSDERDEAMTVVESIRREVAHGVSPDQIAVFYRINAQSRVLEEAFRAAGVAYQVIGGLRFFERAEVKDLLAYLRLIDNPQSDADLLRIVNVPARGIGNKTIDRLLDWASRLGCCVYQALESACDDPDLGTAAKKKLRAFAELVQSLREEAARTLPSSLARLVLDQTGYRKTLQDADSAEADARLENLDELVGSIAEYEAEVGAVGETPQLAHYLERIALISDVDSAVDGQMAKLMTVHSAKGLEFESVYLTGMEEEMFPYRGLDSNSNEELEEERRLAYVAITRARQRLAISYAHCRTLFGHTRYTAPSRFLSDLPEAAIERIGGPRAVGGLGTWNRSNRSSRFELRQSSFTPGAAEAARPQPAEGERVVDYEAFDDLAMDVPNLRSGSKVLHQRFGRGTVRSVVPGDTPKVVAVFAGWGEKKVLASSLRCV